MLMKVDSVASAKQIENFNLDSRQLARIESVHRGFLYQQKREKRKETRKKLMSRRKKENKRKKKGKE